MQMDNDAAFQDLVRCRLATLGHFDPDGVDIKDPHTVRKVFQWLEEQKICHYQIGDGAGLRSDDQTVWDLAADKYLADLGCPVEEIYTTRQSQLSWLLGLAVKKEYMKDVGKYTESASSNKNRNKAETVKNSINVHSEDFKSKVIDLAKHLKVQSHPDPKVMLTACCMVIKSTVGTNKQPTKGQRVDLAEHSLAVPKEVLSEPALSEALKVLRLLHLRDLRQLQDEINDAIERIQSYTADPKTDTRLGQVGR